MGHYELRGRERIWVEDSTPVKGTKTQSPQYTSSNSGNTYSNTGSYSGYESTSRVTIREPIEICSIWIPIITFVIGQIIEYIVYGVSGTLFVADLIFGGSQWWELLVMSGVGIAGVVFIILGSKKMIDDYEEEWCWAYLIICGLLFLIIPALSTIICPVVSVVIFFCYVDEKEDTIPWKLALVLIVLIAYFVWAAYSNNSIGDVDLKKITSFDEISEYVDGEIVALDISGLDDEYCGVLETGSQCKELVLVGERKTSYKGLKIITGASQITFKNINIANGYIHIVSQYCTLTLLGNNSIDGIDGYSGGTGNDGEDGQSPFVANELALTGRGDLSLVAGNGGDGGAGANGSSAGLFGSGEDGENGGDGGDSSMVVLCQRITSDDFKGNLSLVKGSPGAGGNGGSGGSAGLFGSSGANGWDGYDGIQGEYTTGKIEIDDSQVEYD